MDEKEILQRLSWLEEQYRSQQQQIQSQQQQLLNQEWIRARFDQVEAGIDELKTGLRNLDKATAAALKVHDGRFDILDHHLVGIREGQQEILLLLRKRLPPA